MVTRATIDRLADRVDELADRLGLSFSAFLDSMSDAELERAIAAVKASIAGESIDAESQAMIADLAIRMRPRGRHCDVTTRVLGPHAMPKALVNGKAPGQGDLRLATSSGTLDWGYGCERPGHLLMRRLTIRSI